MKVIDALWFVNPRGACGLVVGEDEKTGERVAKAGVVYGLDEKVDAADILDTGTVISPVALEGVSIILKEAVIKKPEEEPPAPAAEEKPAKPPKTKKAKGK